MEKPGRSSPLRPIGVFQALVAGFDRIAAQPLLLIPPLLLDLFLWFGPHLTIPSIVDRLGSLLVVPAGAEEAIAEQVELIRASFLDLAERVNLLSILSSFPAGIPSLMSGRMPKATPIGQTVQIPLAAPLLIFAIFVALLVVGQSLGTQFHLWIVRAVSPERGIGDRWRAWLRMAALALIVYVAVMMFSLGLVFVTSFFAVLLPILGLMVAFLGFTFIFWAVIYLAFTPHGIVMYRLGILRAMIESVTLVRWNLLPAVGYLGLAFVIAWLGNQVWVLPHEDSWYAILAIGGHAFVSATLLAGSYVFYQSRREWMYSAQGVFTPGEQRSRDMES